MSDHGLLLTVAFSLCVLLVLLIPISLHIQSRIEHLERMVVFLQKADDSGFKTEMHMLRQLGDLSREFTKHITEERQRGTASKYGGHGGALERAATAGYAAGYERGRASVCAADPPDPAGGPGGDLPGLSRQARQSGAGPLRKLRRAWHCLSHL
jgi:hypothetical protein